MERELSRLRVAYRKSDRLAYLGHLEVLRTLERCVRRAGLPFGVSSGFARRMRMQFSQALPVGAASEGEYFDVGLTTPVAPADALAALAAATPPALAPYAAAYVPHFLPSLEVYLNRATWRVEVATDAAPAALDAALAAVAATGTLTYLRGAKEKRVDLAAALVGWQVAGVAGAVTLTLETRSSNAGALRPAHLLDAAFASPTLVGAARTATRVTRAAQRHEAADGELADPFDVTESAIASGAAAPRA